MFWIVVAFVAGTALTSIFSYFYVTGSVIPHACAQTRGNCRKDQSRWAAAAGYGEWAIHDKMTGETRFDYFSRREIAERWNAEQANEKGAKSE